MNGADPADIKKISGTDTLFIVVGSWGVVTLRAHCRASLVLNQLNSAYALADPVFTIDPSFQQADLVELVYAGTIPDVSLLAGDNVSIAPVPLPAAAWLFISAIATMLIIEKDSR